MCHHLNYSNLFNVLGMDFLEDILDLFKGILLIVGCYSECFLVLCILDCKGISQTVIDRKRTI